MKSRSMVSLLILLLILCLTIIPVMADTQPKDHIPYQLTASQMAATDLIPYGSALLTFKINNLPGDTGDTTLTWYVNIEKKIDQGEWIIVSNIPSVDFMAAHQQSPGVYTFEQLWIEDYAWDGSKKISYRVNVVLDDLVSNRGSASAYSNIASLGLISSAWAVPELQKADALGLIPDILKGADMTKPITREEFAELAVVLHGKVSGLAASPVSPNPFSDTQNTQILKAFNLGIVKGISPTTFEPKTLVTREQCAAMLFRTLKGLRPDADYSVAGIKNFPDQKEISSYAVEATKYMAKSGIITGDAAGNFMPKATTDAQKAAGYGMATREQAVALAMRTYNSIK